MGRGSIGESEMEIAQQVGENSRADSDNWWRRSTDEASPFAAPGVNNTAQQEAASGAGYSHCSARRTSSLPDTLAVAPPKDLTIPEHPGQMDSGANEAYIQRKTVLGHAKGPDAVQVSSGTLWPSSVKYRLLGFEQKWRVCGCRPCSGR